MSDAVLSLVVLAGAVRLSMWNKLPVGVVAILTALTLYVTGLVDLPTALGGFGDPVALFITARSRFVDAVTKAWRRPWKTS